MDVDELELSDARHEHRVDVCVRAQPLHQLAHLRRHSFGRRRRVDDLVRAAVGDVVLDEAVAAWVARAAAHAVDKSLVDLADQALGDRLAAVQVLRHELERTTVVEQLAHIVAACARDRMLAQRPRVERTVADLATVPASNDSSSKQIAISCPARWPA